MVASRELLSSLTELVPPPARLQPTVDWGELHERLGLVLPIDYKALIETYGPGAFDDFIWVLQPGSSNQNIDLEKQITVRRRALEVMPRLPANICDLIPWAFTDNGDTCYWWTNSHLDRPNDWRVWVNEGRGPTWEKSDLTAAHWLTAVLSGKTRLSIFPKDFPSRQPMFRRIAFESN